VSKPLVEQLRELGVAPGDVLLVHSSFRALRAEGGPDALIDALIEVVGPEGTIVMPSWSDDDDEVFDPAAYEVDEHLGVVADEFWQRPDVFRGTHPFAVAAWGKHAEWVAAAPFILPPHAVGSGVSRVHDLDGKVLLLGVDHSENTTIHLGELLAEVPYRKHLHITVLEDGKPKRIDYDENDHCCEGFRQMNVWLNARGLQREGPVAQANAKLVRSRDITATVIEELFDEPTRFLCKRGTGCDECDEAWLSVVR
jgi:aminoglycoside N3'-acetyltransferase